MSTTTTWNPQTHAEYDALKGYDVHTSDDEKIGTIKDVLHPQMEMPAARGHHVFRVVPGTLKKLFSDMDEVYVQESMIRVVNPDDERVVLTIPKDRLKHEDWGEPANMLDFRR